MTHPSTVAATLAAYVTAARNCARHDNAEWLKRWKQRATELLAANLPSGSGVTFDWDEHLARTDNALRFSVPYRPMNEYGYQSWINYRVIVRPDWNGIEMRVTGPATHRDYIGDIMHAALTAQIQE